MSRPRFIIYKDIYPCLYAELSKELRRHVPECPHFSEEETGFLVMVLLREKIILLNPSAKFDSVFVPSPRDSVAIQNFILKMRQQIIVFYSNRRIKLLK